MSVLVVGLSHKSAPLHVLERAAISGDALAKLAHDVYTSEPVAGTFVVATCNRVEVYAEVGKFHAGVSAISELLARHSGVDLGELTSHLYVHYEDRAIQHLLAVACGLDSMVLGEPQILGQVKDAYEAAVAAGALKGMLGRCVSRAFAVAKRVRSETAIGAGTVSISSVAVDLARRIFGDLSKHLVLLLGAGEMAEAAARSLGKGARGLVICNRSFDRAAALAGQMHASAVPWDQLEQELVQADVVVASTASRTPVVTRDMVKRAMKARKGRTLFFVDIAVPRNVEPAVHGIDNVYVFNVDDLEQEVARGLEARHAELAAAEKIVADEVAEFLAWTRGLEVQPTVVAMRTKARAVLLAELERSLAGRLKHLGEADRAALTQMMESAVAKLLHAPTTKLKARAADGDDAGELAAAVRFLFDLQEIVVDKERDGAGTTGDGARTAGKDDDGGRLPN
jgi:glutamyl-tRNA reductase